VISKWQIAICIFALSLEPWSAKACPSPRTYDLADPGANVLEDNGAYSYFIGRVLEISTSAQLPGVLITFEVLTDYRVPPGRALLKAYVTRSPCAVVPGKGDVGKFGLRNQNGQLTLITTQWSF
jgi:hypothetical protein